MTSVYSTAAPTGLSHSSFFQNSHYDDGYYSRSDAESLGASTGRSSYGSSSTDYDSLEMQSDAIPSRDARDLHQAYQAERYRYNSPDDIGRDPTATGTGRSSLSISLGPSTPLRTASSKAPTGTRTFPPTSGTAGQVSRWSYSSSEDTSGAESPALNPDTAAAYFSQVWYEPTEGVSASALPSSSVYPATGTDRASSVGGSSPGDTSTAQSPLALTRDEAVAYHSQSHFWPEPTGGYTASALPSSPVYSVYSTPGYSAVDTANSPQSPQTAVADLWVLEAPRPIRPGMHNIAWLTATDHSASRQDVGPTFESMGIPSVPSSAVSSGRSGKSVRSRFRSFFTRSSNGSSEVVPGPEPEILAEKNERRVRQVSQATSRFFNRWRK